MDIDFKNALNAEQYAAVTGPDGALLVLAAAGTGKTRTLVYRVAYLVSRGVAPERILLLTFTNRAAGEMLDRARELVGPAISGVLGGTFHHLANRLLRRHAPAVGYKHDYTILDREDSRKLVTESVKALKLGGPDFPKANVLLGVFGSAVNSQRPVGDVAESVFSDVGVVTQDVVRVYQAYDERKRELDAMDFDDMLVHCLTLLQERQDVLAAYQERFLHILVDEYQDTNPIQAQIVDLLAAKHGNVMVVGDDFQSIYSWRGADYRNIMSFPDRYEQSQQYKLETNYRSVPQILEVANACIRGNPDQFQKSLIATREDYERPVFARMRDGEAQGRYLADRIRSLRREGYRYRDIVVLYRAHYHSMEVQLALTQEGIPYTVTSGTRFFEQAHIKDVCSVLRILETPEDELAFRRLVTLLPRVGERTAEKMWEKLGGSFDASSSEQRKALAGMLPPVARIGWDKISPVLAAYHDEELKGDGGEIIHRFVTAFYGDHAVVTYENADRRLDDISELILYTSRFESVERFLSDVALLTNLDAEFENVAGSDTEQIRLSTVHQAKGLEWPVVLIVWMTEGMFPSAKSLNDSYGGEAEERRLFYVAVTRAKDELYLCVPEVRRMRDGGVLYCTPSRFIEELPPELLREDRPSFI